MNKEWYIAMLESCEVGKLFDYINPWVVWGLYSVTRICLWRRGKYPIEHRSLWYNKTQEVKETKVKTTSRLMVTMSESVELDKPFCLKNATKIACLLPTSSLCALWQVLFLKYDRSVTAENNILVVLTIQNTKFRNENHTKDTEDPHTIHLFQRTVLLIH